MSCFASLWPSFLRRGPGCLPPASKVQVQPLEQHPPGPETPLPSAVQHTVNAGFAGAPRLEGPLSLCAPSPPLSVLKPRGISSGNILGGSSFQQASAWSSLTLNQSPFVCKNHVINLRLKGKTVSLVSQRGGWSRCVENACIGSGSATLQLGDLGQGSKPHPPSVFSSAKERGGNLRRRAAWDSTG